MKLTKSKVVFNEEQHTYMLDNKRLLGITDLIHQLTGLGVYPEANEYTKNYAIPHAGARGTAVHNAIELYDKAGIFSDTMYTHWREANGTLHNEEFETAAALQGYIDAKEQAGMVAVANEYTVTDNDRWSSNIDQIWAAPKAKKEVVLVDTKTNNLDYYPGGKATLKQYLSWQLSIYAELFEAQNPKIKVSGLKCYWTNTKEWEVWDIDRLDKKFVDAILSATYTFNEDGVTYDISEENKAIVSQAFPKDDSIKAMLAEIAELQVQYKLYEARLNEAKLNLLTRMRELQLTNAETDMVKVAYVPAKTSYVFDSARFKSDHADLFADYQKESFREDSIRITIKK